MSDSSTSADTREVGILAPEKLAAESGLDLLRGMIAGRHPAPPFAVTADILMTEAEEGRVVFRGRPSADFLNPLGTVHGGWTCAILDSAMGCAVHSTLAPGQGYTTVELKVNLVRALLPSTGEVTCEGRLVHRGATIATSEGFLRDASGRLLAHGTETCMIFDARRLKRDG